MKGAPGKSTALAPRQIAPKAAPRASPAERALMAGTPLQMGTGAGAGMHASNRHTDAYMAQMYSTLEDMGVSTADMRYGSDITALARACASAVARQNGACRLRPRAQCTPGGR